MILVLLKWMGIILLVLLFAALFLLCLILFVPIRYHVRVVFGENIQLRGYGSFLLHLLHVSFCVEGGEEHHKIRVLGIPLREKDESSGKKRRKRRSGRKQAKRDKKEELPQETGGIKKAEGEEELSQETGDIEKAGRREELPQETGDVEKAEREEELPQETGDIQITEWIEDGGRRKKSRTADVAQEIEDPIESGFVAQEETEKIEEEGAVSEKAGFFHKIFERIGRFLLSIRARFVRIYKRLQKIFSTAGVRAEDLRRRSALIREILQDENTPQLWKLLWRSIRLLLQHTRLRRIRGRIVFGTGDPCTTGQILGVAGMCYAVIGPGVEITPDFERTVLDGELGVWGRVQIGVVVYLVLRIMCSGEWKHFKEQTALW